MQRELPILFSTAMVQAILCGNKTQTRRVIRQSFNGCLTNGGPHPSPSEPLIAYPGEVYESPIDGEEPIKFEGDSVTAWFHCSTLDVDVKCPYGKPGDLLWIREPAKYKGIKATTGFHFSGEKPKGYTSIQEVTIEYNADEKRVIIPYPQRLSLNIKLDAGLPNGVFKEAARIWLKVKNVVVERLQDISESDSEKEGIELIDHNCYKNYDKEDPYQFLEDPIGSFKSLWQSINCRESWDINPWVWVVEFEVLSTTGKPEGL